MDLDLDLDLVEACKNGDLERLKKLFRENNNIDINKYYNKDHNGSCVSTLLLIACNNKRIKIVNFLLENGADPNITYECCAKWTPLHSACHYGYLEIVDALVNAGANLFIKVNDYTPLDIAKLNSNNHIIEKYKDYKPHKLIKAANKNKK